MNNSDIESWLRKVGRPIYHPDIENVDWPMITSLVPASRKTTFCGHLALATEVSNTVFAVATDSVVILRLPEHIKTTSTIWARRSAKGRQSKNLTGWWECGLEDSNGLRCLQAFHRSLGLDLRWTGRRNRFLPFNTTKFSLTVSKLNEYTREVRCEIKRVLHWLANEFKTDVPNAIIKVSSDCSISPDELRRDLNL